MRRKKIEFALLFALFVLSWFAPLIAKAQTGEITGRVVAEDGGGLPNVMVYLNAVVTDRRAASAASACSPLRSARARPRRSCTARCC